MSADGPLNIYNAVAIAADPTARGRGVLVAIDDDIHSAHDVVKRHSTDVATFSSGEAGLVGAVLFGKTIWYRTPTSVNTTKSDLAIVPGKPLPRVDIIYAHANMSPDIIDSAVEKGAKSSLAIRFWGFALSVLHYCPGQNMRACSLDAACFRSEEAD